MATDNIADSGKMPQSYGQRLLRLIGRIGFSRKFAWLMTIAALVCGVSTYVVMTQHTRDLDTVFWLLNLDLAFLLLLGAMIARQVVRLWAERKKGIAGSRLHVRIVFIFGILAATPAIMMAIFSSVFFHFGVQAWFNDRVSTAVNESLAVANAYLKEHQQVIRADVLAMANDLNREPAMLMSNAQGLNAVIQTQSMLRDLSEVMIFTPSGQILGKSRLTFSLAFDSVPQDALEQAEGGEVVLLDSDTDDRIRALVKLDTLYDAYLLVGRFVDGAVLEHMETAEKAVHEYSLLEGKRSHFQLSFTMLFVAVALLLLLAAVWFGLVFAQQLARPIGLLIGAAERVSAGDLSVRVSDDSGEDDELAQLANAFNHMTEQIEGQRDALMYANRTLDDRRRFMEAVLAGASSGVVGLDHLGNVTLANAKAAELLQVERGDLVNSRLEEFLPAVADLFQQAFKNEDRSGQVQVDYKPETGPKRTLLVRMTAEQGGGEDEVGAVVTFDDISALVAAQRKAAWADVARRIAHEIKNPLTPIQLSAERLKRRYLKQIDEDPETFSRCTETIVRQVGEIGRMVNEFSEFARMPEPMKKKENIVDVFDEATVLQRQAHPDIKIELDSAAKKIIVNCDRAQIGRVVTNLVQNAIDAIEQRREQTPGDGLVDMQVSEQGDSVTLTVTDNGTGLPEDRENLLEPYVTMRKKKGTGLGLAIVRKILEDHGGSIALEDAPQDDAGMTGARIVVTIPKEG